MSWRGRAPLLSALAALIALVVAAVVLLLRRPANEAPPLAPSSESISVTSEAPRADEPTPAEESGALARNDAIAGDPPAAREAPRGTLLVVLSGLPERSPLPVEVVVSAWRAHAGAPLEVRSRTHVPAGLSQTQVQLPGGSYSVRAAAPGWISASQRADLDVRTPQARVELALGPCAWARGAVLQHDGAPAFDVAVHATDAAGQWLASTTTGFDGSYALDALPPAAGRLVVGVLGGPLVPPLEVDWSALAGRVPDVHLPPTGRIAIEVRDALGAGMPDLALEGLSDAGMRLELWSDASGVARAEFVPPGAWRIYADAGALGRGNVLFDVAAGAEVKAELRLRR